MCVTLEYFLTHLSGIFTHTKNVSIVDFEQLSVSWISSFLLPKGHNDFNRKKTANLTIETLEQGVKYVQS